METIGHLNRFNISADNREDWQEVQYCLNYRFGAVIKLEKQQRLTAV